MSWANHIGEKAKSWLPWIVLGTVFVFWLVIYVLRIPYLLDSDMSSELLLSKLLSEQGGVLLKDWRYSTELRVLNNQLVFSAFFHLFHSWYAVRVFSGIVLFLLLLGSYAYLCAQAGLWSVFPCTAPLLFLPLTRNYAYIVLYGLFYIPHISISFFSLGLLLASERGHTKRRRRICLGLLGLLAFLAAMGGPRQLVILYLPLFLYALFRSWREGRFRFAGAYLALAAALLGYAVNHFILAKHYRFNGWSDISFTEFSYVKLESLLRGLLANLGFVEAQLSIAALVKCGIALFLAAVLLGAFVHAARNTRAAAIESRILYGVAFCALALHFLLYLFTDMYYEDRYYLPLLALFLPLLALGIRDAKGRFCRQLCALCVLAVCVAGAWQLKELAGADSVGSLRSVVDVLRAQHYESGYASFWNGNIVTELADGEIEMYNYDDHVDGIIDVDSLYIWLQQLTHADKIPQGKCFLLLTTQEEAECPLTRYLKAEDALYRDDAYVVYAFASHEEMLAQLSFYCYDLTDDAYLDGGEAVKNSYIVHPQGSVAGPNMTLYAGSYSFTVQGSGISQLQMEPTAAFGEQPLAARIYRHGDKEAVWEIDAAENLYHVEFRLQNTGAGDIRIEKASVARK